MKDFINREKCPNCSGLRPTGAIHGPHFKAGVLVDCSGALIPSNENGPDAQTPEPPIAVNPVHKEEVPDDV